MTESTNAKPRVLIVGAYERDNFGDLLFLLVTERHLGDAEVVAAAPFESDMTELLDRHVPAYGPLLAREKFDVIWTAGGQVGGIDVRNAYRLSAPPEEYEAFERGSAQERARLLQERLGTDRPVVSPYMPSPSAYPLNDDAITVLNSVGLAGIRGVSRSRREELITLLRDATHISVRDKESSDFLTSLGIEHSLVPDVVHAISVHHPAARDPGSDLAIFQSSSQILRRFGVPEVGAALARSRQLKGLRIRLLAAGTATGHDSFEDFEELIHHVRKHAPRTDIEVIRDRRPLDLVDHISRARVVIGTSLHVRIISCAYGIPRVTLRRTKPTRYARVWDPDMPYDVTLPRLDDAIEQALAAGERPEVAARAADLTRLAYENLESLADRVLTAARTQTEEDRELRRKLRARNQVTLREHRFGCESEISKLEESLAKAKRELSTIRSSRTYRLAQRLARVYRAVRPGGARRS